MLFLVSVLHLNALVLCSVQLDLIQSIVAEVNKKTGEAECQFYRRGLSYLEDSQRLPEIQQSRFLYCHGELKSNKGQVGSCSSPILFDRGLGYRSDQTDLGPNTEVLT